MDCCAKIRHVFSFANYGFDFGCMMTESILKKALNALDEKGVTLAESVNRIFLILPGYGRLNVAVTHRDGESDIATLTVQPDGRVSCRLSDEPRDYSPIRKEW